MMRKGTFFKLGSALCSFPLNSFVIVIYEYELQPIHSVPDGIKMAEEIL